MIDSDTRFRGRASSSSDGSRPANVSHPVEEVDKWLRREVEGAHRRGDRQRGARIPGDRKALRSELAQDDMEERDDAEGEGVRNDVGGDACRVQELLEGGLADEAETDRRDCNPDLARREIGVEMIDRMPQRTGARRPCALELTDLGRADASDRELGGDEEAVRRDEQEGADDAESHQALGLVLGGLSASLVTSPSVRVAGPTRRECDPPEDRPTARVAV
jgi:hypothetical protein